jgi:hypothetical protein
MFTSSKNSSFSITFFKALMVLLLIFITKDLFSQGLLLNPTFSEPNICLEFNSPCCFKAWYCIGTASSPQRLKSGKLVQSYQPFPNFSDQYKNAMVGCINHAILPASELELFLEFEKIRPMKIGISFLDSFPVSDSYDVNGLDSSQFQFFDITDKKKQKISLVNSNTALFILVVFIDSQEYGKVNITQLDLSYKNKKTDYFTLIDLERIQFIWKDRNRHDFSNTMNERKIINRK